MLEYKLDFVIGAMSSILMQGCGIIFVWAIFNTIGEINGWSLYEILLGYGLLSMSLAVNQTFFDSFWAISYRYIQPGELDIVMLRPISILFHIISNRLQNEGIGEFIIGISVFSTALYHLGISVGPKEILLIIVFIISGAAIFAAITLIAGTLNFWLIRGDDIMVFVVNSHEFAKFPISIFPRVIRFALSFIIPFAFTSFYPANYFLHKGYQNYSLLSPFVAILLWTAAIQFWKIGLRNYNSTGS